jgi:tetratricopeptide (TPR) repeat protein
MASSAPPFEPAHPREAVFVSYAREDAAVAEAIAEKLRAQGIEVWFDRKELVGGDAWDAKIRRQIRECALFLALVSGNTNARLEGYFRREWKLAVDRTQDMAEERAFLLPIAIDEQPLEAMRVPEKFYEVQWYTLPGGMPDDELVERVRALLSGAASGTTNVPFAVRRAPAHGGAAAAAAPPPAVARPQAKRGGGRRLAWLAAGVALVGLGVYVAYRAQRSPAVADAPRAVATKTPAPGAKTKVVAGSRNAEVRQLVAKATALWEKWDEATRADWTLAEELCQRAVELDRADGESWAVYAQVAFGLHEFFHDTGADDLARERAERAVRLQPASKSARLAMANAYRTNSQTLPEAERLLRQLLAASPDDKRVLRTLGDTLRDRRKYEEAVEFYDRAAGLPGGDHLALLAKSFALESLGRYEEAEAAVDASLALRKGAAATVRKVDCRLNFHGDLDGAERVLARVPATARLDDRAVSLACQLWLWKRKPDNCLDALNAVSRDFLQGYYWSGAPKHWLLGKVHQLAGRSAAAEAQWRLAMKAIEKARTEAPDAVDLIFWSANVKARLGLKAEAQRDLDLALQLSASGASKNTTHVAAIQLLLGRKREALDLLEAKLKTAAGPSLRNELRFDPAFDPLRGDPRFEAMVAAKK